MGESFIKYSTLNIKSAFAESSPKNPILINMMRGSEVTEKIIDFSMGQKLEIIPLGQGKGKIA